MTFHETKLIVDFVTIVIKDMDDSRIFVWSFKRWSILTGTLNHKEQHQLLVFMFKINGVKLVRHLTFDFKLRLRSELRSLMHIICFMSWLKSLSHRWPFFIDFLCAVFRHPLEQTMYLNSDKIICDLLTIGICLADLTVFLASVLGPTMLCFNLRCLL